MSWLRFFLILLIPLICHAWLWKRKSKSSPASSRTPRYTSSSRTPTHSWTARKPSIRRPSIRRPSRPACSTKSSCESCTSHRSWSGSCRWCPDDGGCHAAGAVLTNPCRRSENIVNKWNCYRARKTTPRPKTPKPPTTSTPKQRCKTMTTCVSCTSHKSWSGSSCRWCPKDERCHAYGAILTNPCRRSQNIVNKWNCNRAPKTTPRPTTPKPPTTSTPMQRCKTMTTCVSCTSHKSWSGSSCRWCPKDERCHAYGAIFTNPCRRSQNIVNKESCSNSSSGTLTPKTSKPSTSRKRCITKTNCTSCTSHKSWSGSSCSWCPKDGKCHAHGAIWTNPCRTFQNIVNKDSCSLKLPSRRPPRTQCITKTNCTSCTSHKSWSGRPCRWCPKDGKCHAHGAIWTNPCTQSQNIVKKESCPILTSVELCINKTNCASCTSHKSSSGFPCRWCLKDGKCHAHDAISTNLCKGSENIVNKERCFPPPCRIMTNCSSCTSHQSSSGRPCRWCPEDNKCHNYTASFTNLCKGSENIVNKERCFPPPCRIMTNCSSCTSHQSSSGRPCRWCPEDNKCHNYTASFTNLCNGSENIVNKERCFPPPCRIMTNCSSCTSHQSSSGRPCRWCPEDNKCHNYTASFTNLCNGSENIVNKERCFPPPCRIMTNCSSCTSHQSSSGRPCRWCPKDNKCHNYTASFTNLCNGSENIVNKERCFPPPCRIMTNCSSCTSHQSSSGRPCRWCPEDNKCHNYTASFTNLCNGSENIVNKERCFPPPCRIMTNCSSCTSHQSSSGRPCRWCPKDNKCHNYTASFTNLCNGSENIVNKERCFPPPCRIMTNCSSCTSHQSSSGRPCRWCPEDNKCHAYTAIFTNPCRIRQNIVNKERCFPPPCTIMTNCSSCTSHKSSSGRPCRWCPEDNKCHAYTAIFTNPCRIRQNIVNKERCFPPPCRIMTNCSSCTSHMSSSGFLCRWCPEDNKCYAHDATFTNSCSIFQNININGSCPFPSSYDRNLSYKMVVLSALAYADNVSNYIAKAAKVDTFRVVKQISNPCRSSKCPGLTTCSGFIAVSEKEKAIAIVFRGAQSRCQALYGHGPSVPLSVLSEYVLDKYNPVQTYFSDQFQKIWNDMKLDVYSQIDKHPSYELWVTGHCLGGALASLASTHIAVERKTPKNKLILYTFGQPRVGNYNYSLAHDMLVPISFRVVYYGDPVVHVPNCNSKVQPGTLSRCQAGLGPYHHGKEIFYNEMFNNSSYKTCDGLPRNEDVTCSNKLFAPRIEDQLNNLELYHYKYFGFDVRRYM